MNPENLGFSPHHAFVETYCACGLPKSSGDYQQNHQCSLGGHVKHEHDGSGCIECACNAVPWSADDCVCPGGFS